LVSSHHEKQTFLKVIYENFYKVYNRKAADRLGVVYTPNEIVRFMIESADWLCHHHFGRGLIDRNVEILDPAAGTGTFIAELIEYFRGQPAKLKHKYREELHANEVGILPYYVANLNIEATYAALTGEYEEYLNLCFVDTLDNVGGLRIRGPQGDLFGAVSEENVVRIKRQNSRKISVIISNPPYNANQLNENENNKNRTYPAIDKRIKETYIAASTAQKTKLYDMYVRFFRWAGDRISENGIISFITNRSFVDRLSFDGVRKSLSDEFSHIYVIDLGGDIRELSGKDGIFLNEDHTIFGISAAVGIAITFLVKKVGAHGKEIRYVHPCDIRATREEKFSYLQTHPIGSIPFEMVSPDKNNNWTNLTENDFETFVPIAGRATKSVRVTGQERAIFRLYSLGISTNRDEWLYDRHRLHLEAKASCLIAEYDRVPPTAEEFPETLKWSETLKRRKRSAQREGFAQNFIRTAAYRPFLNVFLYQSPLFIDRPGLAEMVFPAGAKNTAICFSDVGSRMDYCVLAVDGIADLHFGAAVDAYQQVPRFRFSGGERIDNITDWALDQFRAHYEAREAAKPPITKDAIFYYVYGVLHHPTYREKYALNLKREFPRIPFYDDFWCWAEWGERLMALHIACESVEPWLLVRCDVPDDRARQAGLAEDSTARRQDRGRDRARHRDPIARYPGDCVGLPPRQPLGARMGARPAQGKNAA
jgi:predicted helicase